MTHGEFQAMLQAGSIFLDGATGSNLRAQGMPIGINPETWMLAHPSTVIALQRAYLDAGTQIVCAPTFGANRVNLASYGLADQTVEYNRRLTAISKEAVGSRARVAGDMTTTSRRVDRGEIDYGDLMEIYREQADALASAGVDLFIVETMLGVTECGAAVEAIRSICDLPILCMMSLDSVGGAYFDGDAEALAAELPLLGADAVGVNCGQGVALYENVIARMAALADVPIVAKPNAGMPVIQADGSAVYGMDPMRFAHEMRRLQQCGARILGGCCGTTPEHIRAMVQLCKAPLDAR